VATNNSKGGKLIMSMNKQDKAMLLEQIKQVRAGMSRFPLPKDGLDIQVGTVKELIIKTSMRETPVKMYAPDGKGPFPAVIYAHGGAFCLTSNAVDESIARQLARDVNCIVFSVDYGLAPEYPFPNAIEEIYEVIKNIISHADDYCVESQKIAIGGNSAGATLALSVSILANERKEFSISAISAIYPVLDLTISDSEKRIGKAAKTNLPSALMSMCVEKAYLEGDLSKLDNTLVSPGLIKDASFMPPTLIISAEHCPFTKEHGRFVEKLKDAGVEVLHKVYPGLDHGFMDMAGFETYERDCKALICSQLKSIFSR
jgi:acetyl esterase